MGIMPAYFGRSTHNPALNGCQGAYYHENPGLRCYVTADVDAEFALLVRRLKGEELQRHDGADVRLTLVTFNVGMRLSLPMYVENKDTWGQHYTLMTLGSWFKPKGIPPYTPDLWCNGGEYSQVLVNFDQLSCACNLRVWGEHEATLLAAVQDAIDYTNTVRPKG